MLFESAGIIIISIIILWGQSTDFYLQSYLGTWLVTTNIHVWWYIVYKQTMNIHGLFMVVLGSWLFMVYSWLTMNKPWNRCEMAPRIVHGCSRFSHGKVTMNVHGLFMVNHEPWTTLNYSWCHFTPVYSWFIHGLAMVKPWTFIDKNHEPFMVYSWLFMVYSC
mgnify:CR=1 FL=1